MQTLYISVASRMGLPKEVVERARHLLTVLEDRKLTDVRSEAHAKTIREDRVASYASTAVNFVQSAANVNCKTTLGLAAATGVLVETAELSGFACKNNLIYVGEGQEPPPSTVGYTFVYLVEVLRLQQKKEKIGNGSSRSKGYSYLAEEHKWTGTGQVYCGETDDIHQRVYAHRKKGLRGKHKKLHFVCFRLRFGKNQIQPGKSDARQLETLTIRALAAKGFALTSGTDGNKHLQVRIANAEITELP